MSTPMSVEQYRDLILQDVAALPSAQLPLAQCLGLTTTATVTAHVAVPPFTNSAMDGFAVHAEDVASASPNNPVTLQVIGEVPAGAVSDEWVGNGQAVRVMTGAAVPGYDAKMRSNGWYYVGRWFAQTGLTWASPLAIAGL